MEVTFLDAQKDIYDENDTVFSLSEGRGLAEDDGLPFVESNHGRLLERMKEERPLTTESCSISSRIDDTFEIKQCYRASSLHETAVYFLTLKDCADYSSCLNQLRTSHGCSQKAYHENPFIWEARISNCKNFISVYGQFTHCYSDLLEVSVSDPLSIIGRLVASFNILLKPRSSKVGFVFGNLKHGRKRTKSTSDLSNFLIQSAVLAGPVGDSDVSGNVRISPVGRWIINSIEGNGNLTNILKRPLSLRLVDLDRNMSLKSSKLMDIKEIRCLELDNSPVLLHNTSSEISVKESLHRENRRHQLDPAKLASFKRRGVSFPNFSLKDSYSDHSISPAHASVSKGLLHCIWKGGIPYFVFSVDDQGEVYVANPWKVKSEDDSALNWIYLFRCRMDGQKKQGKGGCDVSDLVAKMKVSSSMPPKSNKANPSNFFETEFVLFGISEGPSTECVREVAPLSPILRKNKRVQKKVVDMFRTNLASKNDSTTKFGRVISKYKDIPQGPFPDMRSNLDVLSGENLLADYLPSNLELAAIVVKGYHNQNSNQEAAIGGWGLKFLEKVANERADSSLRSSSDDSHTFSENCQESGSRSESKIVTSMSILLPAGFHGGPMTRNGGPSTLTDRWRSGGHCDCGGWDIGCPLTVLNNRPNNRKGLPELGGEEDCKSVDLFIEGTRQDVPVLKMVNIHDGLYFIHFQSTLSALQSFSIGVAIIHAQSPVLRSKMYSS